jgi:hypothetical protein
MGRVLTAHTLEIFDEKGEGCPRFPLLRAFFMKRLYDAPRFGELFA